MKQLKLHKGDALTKLRCLPSNSFDGCLTDPPYGLNFMGEAWDKGVPSADVWREVFRVMRPGSFLLAFGGTRTFHRLTCAIEDAGFEIRDCITWLYGSGFPKSLDISKAIDAQRGAARKVVGINHYAARRPRPRGKAAHKYGFKLDHAITAPASTEAQRWNGYGTALKPAWEPCIVAMKPTEGTFAANVLTHGTGALNIEHARIGTTDKPRGGGTASGNTRRGAINPGRSGGNGGNITPAAGRFPANLILDDTAGAALDAQSGPSTSRAGNRGFQTSGQHAGRAGSHPRYTPGTDTVRGHNDAGGASRFFYCAKASQRERNAGLAHMASVAHGQSNAAKAAIKRGLKYETSFGVNSTKLVKNDHPCVKPIDLNRYLGKLILPPARKTARRLLVPFSGSGSEIIGGLLAGWDEAVGIELDARHVEVSRRRVRYWVKDEKRSRQSAHVPGRNRAGSSRPGPSARKRYA